MTTVIITPAEDAAGHATTFVLDSFGRLDGPYVRFDQADAPDASEYEKVFDARLAEYCSIPCALSETGAWLLEYPVARTLATFTHDRYCDGCGKRIS